MNPPLAATPDSTSAATDGCPDCGAGTANVQGLTACPECGWTTN